MSNPAQDYLGYEEEKPLDYKRYIFLFRKNFYVIFTLMIITATLASIYAYKIPDLYKTSAQLLVERSDTAFDDINRPNSGGFAGDFSMEYYKTQQALMTSRGLLTEVAKTLQLKNFFEVKTDEQAGARLTSMVSANQVPRSRIFYISAKSTDPRLAANVANETAKAYIRKSFEATLFYNQEILNWLEQAEKSETKKVSIQDPFGRIKELTYDELIDSLPAVQSNQTLRGLKEKEAALISELESLGLQYRSKHPVMIKAKANLKFIQDSISNEVKNSISKLKSKARGNFRANPGRILEEAAVPGRPIPVNRAKTIAMAVAAQLFITCLLIFLIDHFDDTIHSMEDLQRKGILLPFLGPVPLLKGRHKSREAVMIYANSTEKSELVEAFRYLRVAINFSATPESLKVLSLTSCLPHEGKSFVSQNIAISLANDGNRTLLIDADLRRPTAQQAFRLDNSTGLSSYLTGNMEMETVVKETFVENLFVIPSGPVSPNPAEILGSDRMVKLLEMGKQKYDRLIVDCPPLTGIGDGFVVGSLIGHTILVISASKTPADLIRHTQSHLDKAGIKILGMILNMVDLEKERHGGYTKYYYHTYNRYYARDEET